MTGDDRERDRAFHRLEVLVAEGGNGAAADIEAGLRDLGCVVPPPARSVGDALALLRAFQPDLALVGAHLAGGRPAVVAEALAGMGVPFAVMIAPGDDQLDGAALRCAPRLGKPPGPGELRRAILELLRHRFVQG
jgi:hypothetical protein